MTRIRLGEPIELPWWVFAGALPPALVLVGALLGPGSAASRFAGGAASVGMVAALVVVARRVRSQNLQSVWLSAAYALWFFVALLWVVAALRG